MKLSVQNQLRKNLTQIINLNTLTALASAKARGVMFGGARPNQKPRHDVVKKDADDRAKTVEPIIKAMRDSGNTWDQIAKHMYESYHYLLLEAVSGMIKQR